MGQRTCTKCVFSSGSNQMMGGKVSGRLPLTNRKCVALSPSLTPKAERTHTTQVSQHAQFALFIKQHISISGTHTCLFQTVQHTQLCSAEHPRFILQQLASFVTFDTDRLSSTFSKLPAAVCYKRSFHPFHSSSKDGFRLHTHAHTHKITKPSTPLAFPSIQRDR